MHTYIYFVQLINFKNIFIIYYEIYLRKHQEIMPYIKFGTKKYLTCFKVPFSINAVINEVYSIFITWYSQLLFNHTTSFTNTKELGVLKVK